MICWVGNLERTPQGGSRWRSLEQLQADVGGGGVGWCAHPNARQDWVSEEAHSCVWPWILALGWGLSWSVFTSDRPSVAFPGTVTSSWCLASHSGHPKMTRWEHHSFGSLIAALLSYSAGPSSHEPAQVQEEMAQTPPLDGSSPKAFRALF